MLIKTLRMENFRQFRGTTKVDFSCDPETIDVSKINPLHIHIDFDYLVFF